MKQVKRIIDVLREHKEELRGEFKVSDMGVFGSYIRGEENDGSDVDVLVEFTKPIGLFKFVELERYLGEIIGQKVDLVMKSALKPRIGKHILAEVVYI